MKRDVAFWPKAGIPKRSTNVRLNAPYKNASSIFMRLLRAHGCGTISQWRLANAMEQRAAR
jgi:hypothetical protein